MMYLLFGTGILVNAMRKGYWIILDELNLAPTDVLEALNRVLCVAEPSRKLSLEYYSVIYFDCVTV